MNADIFCIYVDQVLVPALAPGDYCHPRQSQQPQDRGHARGDRGPAWSIRPLLTAPISTGSRRPSPGSKELLRKIAAALTVSALWDPRFTPEECANYLANIGYVSVKQNPL